MKNYALIENGTVVNVVVWDGDTSFWSVPDGQTAVLIKDGDLAYIGLAYADGIYAQPPEPAALPLTLPQQAAQMMLSGLGIVSTATPSLNGTYAVDQLSQMDIIAIETSLNAGKGFPGGADSFNYADMSGVMHSFTAPNFTDFAAAVRDYVYALKSVVAGASTTLPSSTTTVA